MFSKHVRKNISAYCHGELSTEESRVFAEHIIACNKCRNEFEQIKEGIKLAEQLPLVSAPDSLWTGIVPLLGAQKVRELPVSRRAFFDAWQAKAGIAAALLLALGFGLYSLVRRTQKNSESAEAFWNVERLNGAPLIGHSAIESKGKLRIGQWLETDAASRAQIEVGSIGQVQVDPNTRVRLVQTQPTEHRLELAQGKMSALIWAPPKLFFVDTPSAVAADLGCAYTLEVDEQGRGLLRVTAGWVALELRDRESMVPAGAACETRPGVGPGTPYFEDASDEFRHALAEVDFDSTAQNSRALSKVLDASRRRDTLTLWNLLSRVEGPDREHVYQKLASIVSPPAGVTRDGVLRLDQQMLESWRDQLEPVWGSRNLIDKRVVPNPISQAFSALRNGIKRTLGNLKNH
jgi:anti-sigma factor RsiW